MEFYVYDSSIRPLPTDDAHSAVCVRRADQPSARTTATVRVAFTSPLPDAVEVHREDLAARISVNEGHQVLELDSSACELDVS